MRPPTPSTGSRTRPARPRAADGGRGLVPGRRRRPARRARGAAGAATSPPPRSCRGWPSTSDEIDAVLHALDGGYVPAGPSGSPLRGLVNVLPTGRNFYTVDPQGDPVPAGLRDRRRRWPTRCSRGYLDETGELPARRSGCRSGARRRCARRGDDIAEVLALLGVRAGLGRGVAPGRRPRGRSRWPSWAARASTSRCGSPASSATPSRTSWRCSTTPSQLVAELDEPPTRTTSRAHAPADLAEHGDERRATTRIFGSKPGLVRRRHPAADRVGQLARRRRPRRGLHGLGRLRLRPRPRRRAGPGRHGGQLPADRGGRQEHRHPRARHRRLRRLLPVPRRHGRHGARADRAPSPRRTSATRPPRTRSAPAR